MIPRFAIVSKLALARSGGPADRVGLYRKMDSAAHRYTGVDEYGIVSPCNTATPHGGTLPGVEPENAVATSLLLVSSFYWGG